MSLAPRTATSANWAPSPASRDWSTFVPQTVGGLESTGRALQRDTIAGRLFDARSAFKVSFATVAMHLSKDWRDRLFSQVDDLLDVEEWDERDRPTNNASSLTFIRSMIFLRPSRRPGLGADHEGNLVAAWSNGAGRLTLICRPKDHVRWLISTQIDDGQLETAAGDTVVSRLKDVLQPYEPARWISA